MLRLENLQKVYKTSGDDVHALKGLSVSFRNSEFVAILGPSGCGKTTLLNIIGGLDKATDGDLFIDGISTKGFKDRDWDTYRNERIGFVFQSYNLIPHQTVLENVELALRIAGVKKEERIARSKEILAKVGLESELHKKPNQLSGGQCQRVAIARALVNDPEILLADEPTGALDTKTSIQIMDLLKEVAKDRLVIMVTHNPELAGKYANRIINLLDGEIVGDSNPYQEKPDDIIPYEGRKKSYLPLHSAFGLSWKNLLSKAKRTAMICFAASIGIIGVGAVSAVSSGVTGYIDGMQDDLLSCNPVKVAQSAYDLNSIVNMMSSSTQGEIVQDNTVNGIVNVSGVITSIIENAAKSGSFLIENDITEDYLSFVGQMPEEYTEAIHCDYGEDITNNIFTNVKLEKYGDQSMSLSAMLKTYEAMISKVEGISSFSSLVSMVTSMSVFPGDVDYLLDQYDLIGQSSFPTSENDLILVVDSNGALSDLTLTQYGYFTQEEFFNRVYQALGSPDYNPDLDKDSFTLEELMSKEFTYYPNDTLYTKTVSLSEEFPNFDYSAYEDPTWTTGIPLRISAVLKLKDGLSYGTLSSGIYYTEALSERMRDDSKNSVLTTTISGLEEQTIVSGSAQGITTGISYEYSFSLQGTDYPNQIGFVGSSASFSILGISGSGYTLSLAASGGAELPTSISFYTSELSQKEDLKEYLDLWNSDGDINIYDPETGELVKVLERSVRSDIVYIDDLEVVMSMIYSMITIVTAALIAFVALSLVVSTVMIAIITYVSVIERVKEIGVIRSLGGRKKDVSRLFNAETIIIGLFSGAVGVAFTYLISLIINLIVGSITGIYTIASLTWWVAIILILVSMLLTTISGLIPARLAAKKDPVVALRTE